MTRTRSAVPSSFRWFLLPALGLMLAACAPGAQAINNWPGVSAGEDRLYVAHGSSVYAVDLEGDELWRYPQEPERNLSYFAAPAVAEDGLVYAVAYQGLVVALSAESGEAEWAFPTTDGDNGAVAGLIIASPAIAGDLLLVPTDGGKVFFLDRHSGDLVRTFEGGGQMWSAPRVDGETAFVASLGHTLFAVDLASAETIWDADLGYAIADSPSIEEGRLLSGVLGESLVAIDAADGRELWRAPSQGWLWGSPVVLDGVAYYGDSVPTWQSTRDGVGNIYALDLANPETPLWQKATTAVSTSPVLADGLVIVGFGNGQLAAYDPADGSLIWDELAAGPIQSDPVLAGDLVVVAVTSDDALLQAFEAATGDPAWNFLPVSGR